MGVGGADKRLVRKLLLINTILRGETKQNFLILNV